MSQTTSRPATISDLHGVEGKAELIAGRIVRFMASGVSPSRMAFEIAVSLRNYVREIGVGVAFADGIGCEVDPPLANGRQSFSPDASYYRGALPRNSMQFVLGSPTLAVEVRSKNDYSPSALLEMAAKRADYFEAGTSIVWDVDPIARLILAYQGDPARPSATFGAGQVADAEPAVPGWRLATDDIYS